MSTSFPGVPASAVFPTTLTIPADGDLRNAASVDVAFQQIAHNLARMESLFHAITPGGRLTLTSNVPVTTADTSSGSYVLYETYAHNLIPLWNGTVWEVHSFSAALSQLLNDTTKSPTSAIGLEKPFDMFVWNDAGTLRCTRGPEWATLTSRGTGAGTSELYVLDGRHTNAYAITNGPLGNRGLYVGSIILNGSDEVEDSMSRRALWNKYNRVRRPMRKLFSDSPYAYSSAAFIPAEGGANDSSLFVLRGLDEEPMTVRATHYAGLAADPFTFWQGPEVGIGLDSTSVLATGCIGNGSDPQNGKSAPDFERPKAYSSELTTIPGLGYHTLTVLISGGSSGELVDWYSTYGASGQSGIVGEVYA